MLPLTNVVNKEIRNKKQKTEKHYKDQIIQKEFLDTCISKINRQVNKQ